jgi:hypothetical protein
VSAQHRRQKKKFYSLVFTDISENTHNGVAAAHVTNIIAHKMKLVSTSPKK